MTRRKGEVIKGAGLFTRAVGGGWQQDCESFPLKGEKRGTETRLPNTEQHWKSEDYIAPSCEGHKVCLYSGETKPAGDKATIFFFLS